MTLKINRADKKTLDLVFKFGKFINSEHLTFRFILHDKNIFKENNLVKISFVAPKSIARLAVKRNKLRRKGYSALKSYIKKLPKSLIGVFLFRKYTEDLIIIQDEVSQIFSKIN